MSQEQRNFKKIPKGKGTDGEGGISGIRKRLRDTERLLKRPNLQATAKQDLERRVKALNTELMLKQREANETEIMNKYKYIKHVVLRKITKLEKSLAPPTDDSDDAPLDKDEKELLESELAEQRVNLAYIEFFPRDMKYVSLFPTTATPAETETSKSNSKKRKAASTDSLSADDLRASILKRVGDAVKSGEARKSGFDLRLADVLSADMQQAYLVQTRLVKKVKSAAAPESNDVSKTKGNKVETPGSSSKSLKSAKKIETHNKGRSNEAESEAEQEDDGNDDFFLSGDADADEVVAPIEEINPDDFVVERAVKEKKPKGPERKNGGKKSK
ncbi:18S rRNA maturation protein [Chytriomyces hyalinus]|nr:18S rRNA maturation protein [Chytriomyces hyalinus]